MDFHDHHVQAILKNDITSRGSSAPSSPFPDAPAMGPQSSKFQLFLEFPMEVRLIIYEMALGDINTEAKLNNDRCYSLRKKARREAFDIYFNVLLVNKQLNSEARQIFYQHHLCQLRECRQIYYVCQTEKPPSTTIDGPTLPPSGWKWQLGVHSLRTSNCSSAKALANLRLPMVGLALWLPQRHYPTVASQQHTSEQLAALRTFAQELAAELKSNNTKTNISIHIDEFAHRIPCRAVFSALAPLRASCEQIKTCFMCHGSADLENWMATEIARETGETRQKVGLDSQREWYMCRSISERLRHRHINGEIIKDMRLRESRSIQRLENGDKRVVA